MLEKDSVRDKNIKFELDRLSVTEILQIINNEDKKVAYAVEKVLPDIEAAIHTIVDRLNSNGKLYYLGSGTSGRLGILDASECPPTFGVQPNLINGIIAGGDNAIKNAIEDAEDIQENGRADVEKFVTDKDVVVGIAASGNTPYVIEGVRCAKEIGAVTVGIACQPQTQLSKDVHYPIEVLVGSEVIDGSTRMKAGTAQKMVLNMISTAAMIQLGKVYGNMMVNVQATNNKLRNRAFNIVKTITNSNRKTINTALKNANGNTTAAILMIKYNTSYIEALETLEESNNNFRVALDIVENKKNKKEKS